MSVNFTMSVSQLVNGEQEKEEGFRAKYRKTRAASKTVEDSLQATVPNVSKKRERSSTIDNNIKPWNSRLWNLSEVKIKEKPNSPNSPNSKTKKSLTPQTARREKQTGSAIPLRDRSSRFKHTTHSLELNLFHKKQKQKYNKNPRLSAHMTVTDPGTMGESSQQKFGFLHLKIKGKKYKKRWVILKDEYLFCYKVISVRNILLVLGFLLIFVLIARANLFGSIETNLFKPCCC